MPEQILETDPTNISWNDEDEAGLRDAIEDHERAEQERRYFEWQNRERAEREERERLYFEWENQQRAEQERRHQEELARIEKWKRDPTTVSASLRDSRNPLEMPGSSEGLLRYLQTVELSPEVRQACLDRVDEGTDYESPDNGRRFAQLAIEAVFGRAETAEFIDNFLWNHMGDPVQMGRNMPKNPWVSDGLSEYQHDYNHTLVNGYVEGDDSDVNHKDQGHLIHIRETYEQGVNNKERYLVIIGNIATREVNRFRVNEVNVEPRKLSTRLWVTTDRFDLLSGALPKSTANSESIMERAKVAKARKAAHDRQAFVQLSNQSVLFKRFNGQAQEVSPIINVVRDRRLLAHLAVAAGVKNEAGEAIQLPEYLSERSA